MCIFDFIKNNSESINAISTVVMAIFTIILAKLGREQADATTESTKISKTLAEMERRRDEVQDPYIYIFFEGYERDRASLILQNSGERTLFLRSLRVEIPSDKTVNLRARRIDDQRSTSATDDGELKNISIDSESPVRIEFQCLSSQGQGFELVFQLYTGDPVRIKINPTKLNGYTLKAKNSSQLLAFVE